MSGISAKHLLDHVITPTLDRMSWVAGQPMGTKSARMLLLGTAAHESHCGHYLAQRFGGPARGIYQMEPATESDLWTYIRRKPELLDAMIDVMGREARDGDLSANMTYATAMARIHYWRVPDSLPAHDSLLDLGRYYKEHYNTHLGSATVDQFIGDFRLYAGSVL